jgi:hypothetical protein
MNAFWSSIVTFFKNLGHTIMADIITALPEAQQVLLAAISALIQAGIAYVEAKYGVQSTALKAGEPLSAAQKMDYDNLRHIDAFNYVRTEISKDPANYPIVPDSLLHTGIEIYCQLSKRNAEGNHGNFPGGNSNGA